MTLKEEIIFLISVRKKLENLSSIKTKIDSEFNKLIKELNEQLQISKDAIDIIESIYDLKDDFFDDISIPKVYLQNYKYYKW